MIPHRHLADRDGRVHGRVVTVACRPGTSAGGSRAHGDGIAGLAVHAGRRRVCRVQPAGRTARRQGVRRAELVDGNGESRRLRAAQLDAHGMLSLDPATRRQGRLPRDLPGRRGDRRTNRSIDRQHPHDFFMQLAAVWRIPITGDTGFTLAGGPVRRTRPRARRVHASRRRQRRIRWRRSAHHTFDSTHIAFGVSPPRSITAAGSSRGRSSTAASPTRIAGTSISADWIPCRARTWFRPNDRWEFQVSTGRLTDPEAARTRQRPAHDSISQLVPARRG